MSGRMVRTRDVTMLQSFGHCCRETAHCYTAELFAVPELQTAVAGIAQAVRLLDDRTEHGGEVARRAIDDLQYLCGRGLLLQCLARLGDEPRILHRDHRLR